MGPVIALAGRRVPPAKGCTCAMRSSRFASTMRARRPDSARSATRAQKRARRTDAMAEGSLLVVSQPIVQLTASSPTSTKMSKISLLVGKPPTLRSLSAYTARRASLPVRSGRNNDRNAGLVRPPACYAARSGRTFTGRRAPSPRPKRLRLLWPQSRQSGLRAGSSRQTCRGAGRNRM